MNPPIFTINGLGRIGMVHNILTLYTAHGHRLIMAGGAFELLFSDPITIEIGIGIAIGIERASEASIPIPIAIPILIPIAIAIPTILKGDIPCELIFSVSKA